MVKNIVKKKQQQKHARFLRTKQKKSHKTKKTNHEYFYKLNLLVLLVAVYIVSIELSSVLNCLFLSVIYVQEGYWLAAHFDLYCSRPKPSS